MKHISISVNCVGPNTKITGPKITPKRWLEIKVYTVLVLSALVYAGRRLFLVYTILVLNNFGDVANFACVSANNTRMMYIKT